MSLLTTLEASCNTINITRSITTTANTLQHYRQIFHRRWIHRLWMTTVYLFRYWKPRPPNWCQRICRLHCVMWLIGHILEQDPRKWGLLHWNWNSVKIFQQCMYPKVSSFRSYHVHKHTNKQRFGQKHPPRCHSTMLTRWRIINWLSGLRFNFPLDTK